MEPEVYDPKKNKIGTKTYICPFCKKEHTSSEWAKGSWFETKSNLECDDCSVKGFSLSKEELEKQL